MQIDENHQSKCLYYVNIPNKVHPYFLIRKLFFFLWYFSLNTKLILCKRNMILLAVNFWVHPFIISHLSYLLNHFLYYIDQILNQSSFSVIKPDFFLSKKKTNRHIINVVIPFMRMTIKKIELRLLLTITFKENCSSYEVTRPKKKNV